MLSGAFTILDLIYLKQSLKSMHILGDMLHFLAVMSPKET